MIPKKNYRRHVTKYVKRSCKSSYDSIALATFLKGCFCQKAISGSVRCFCGAMGIKGLRCVVCVECLQPVYSFVCGQKTNHVILLVVFLPYVR